MLPVRLPANEVDELFHRTVATPGYALAIDLEACTIADDGGLLLTFEIDPFRHRCLLEGLDDIGITLQHAAKIAAFEERHHIFGFTAAR